MKKTLIALMLVATMTATAGDYAYLTFQKSDGTLTSVPVSALTLTYSDATVTAANGSATTTFALADLTKMYFSETDESTTTAVESVQTADGPVEVYSLSGVFSGRFDSLSQARQQLRRGVYVVKSGETSYKLQIK